ncbi:MAG: DUF362 domain-containing protein [Thermoproteota archaeon]
MSEVYFASAQLKRYEQDASLVFKFIRAAKKAGLGEVIKKGDLVAVKVHFGQIGGFRAIKPQFIRNLVDAIKEFGGIPFLVDTWGISHLDAAVKNGITYESMGAPVIPINGIRENDIRWVKLEDGLRLKEVGIAGNVYDADVLVNFAHAKGHGSSGYGGAIKNIALGCSAPKNRHELHSMEREEEGARKFQEGMADVVAAVLRKFKDKAIHLNYIMDVAEHCDCASWSPTPIVPDIGIAVSRDIVALEQATLDLINKAPGLPYSTAEKYNLKSGDNKFLIIHGKDPYIQVQAAEKLGLGTTKYDLIEVD